MKAFSSTFPVGKCSCAMTISGSIDKRVVIECEWDPRQPKKLSPNELAQYRAGRDTLLREMMAEIGASGIVTVIEI